MIKNITLTVLLAMLFLGNSVAASLKKFSIDYLKNNQQALSLSEQDIQDLKLVEERLDDYSNIHRLWFQQAANGIELRNGMVSVHIKDGKVVNANSSGVLNLKQKTAAITSPTVDVKNAIQKIFII
ncbi:MAG: hypothetical protein R2807_08040 [Chitinophagales bacterium]